MIEKKNEDLNRIIKYNSRVIKYNSLLINLQDTIGNVQNTIAVKLVKTTNLEDDDLEDDDLEDDDLEDDDFEDDDFEEFVHDESDESRKATYRRNLKEQRGSYEMILGVTEEQLVIMEKDFENTHDELHNIFFDKCVASVNTNSEKIERLTNGQIHYMVRIKQLLQLRYLLKDFLGYDTY
jgi:hypothetical protein